MTNPPPPVAPPPEPVPYGRGAPPGFGGHALVSLLIGATFLYFGWAAVAGLLHPGTNPYGSIWDDSHPQAGQAVPFFQVVAGTAWRDIGALATGVVLIAEAAVYGLMNARPGQRRTLATVVMGLGIIGCIANALSAVMQYQAGYRDLPLYAVVGLILCVLSITSARQLRVT